MPACVRWPLLIAACSSDAFWISRESWLPRTVFKQNKKTKKKTKKKYPQEATDSVDEVNENNGWAGAGAG